MRVLFRRAAMRAGRVVRSGRTKRAGLLGAGIAVVAALGVAIPASAASAQTVCAVTNARTSVTYTDLQTAVGAASSGNTLQVVGTCTGTTSVMAPASGTLTLTIAGETPAGDTSPILDGSQSGTVLSIGAGVTATVKNLTITNGISPNPAVNLLNSPANPGGGGIGNAGTLTLDAVVVTSNNAEGDGGGIWNTGTLTLRASSVAGNYAQAIGGGIANMGSLTLDGTTSISGNQAQQGGGISTFGGSSTVTLNGNSTITGNTAGAGGGVEIAGCNPTCLTDSVTLNNSSSIANNTASAAGGGVYNAFGVLTMNNYSKVTGNATTTTPPGGVQGGGGIFSVAGTVALTGNSSVKGNTADSADGGGGVGMFDGTLTLSGDAGISGNTARTGGGISLTNAGGQTGTITLSNDSTVKDNTASNGLGGGINNFGSVTLNDCSAVTGNSGGGIDDHSGTGTLTTNDSGICDNTGGANITP